MATINLEDLRSGMVLAEDAVHFNGRILLCAGTRLTEQHLTTFKTWGLTEANIEGVSKEEVDANAVEHIDPALLMEVETKMRARFRHADLTHPATHELFRLRVKMCAQQQAVRQQDDA